MQIFVLIWMAAWITCHEVLCCRFLAVILLWSMKHSNMQFDLNADVSTGTHKHPFACMYIYCEFDQNEHYEVKARNYTVEPLNMEQNNVLMAAALYCAMTILSSPFTLLLVVVWNPLLSWPPFHSYSIRTSSHFAVIERQRAFLS